MSECECVCLTTTEQPLLSELARTSKRMPSPSTMSASTQNRIMIWRSEVASAMDDAASSAASSTGNACSLSDSHSSAEYSWSQARSGGGAMARGRRFWRRLARRLSGGRSGYTQDGTIQREPTARTAMYRAPPPPVDARGATAAHEHVVDCSDGNPGLARGGLKEKQERLQRAARLLDNQQSATAWLGVMP